MNDIWERISRVHARLAYHRQRTEALVGHVNRIADLATKVSNLETQVNTIADNLRVKSDNMTGHLSQLHEQVDIITERIARLERWAVDRQEIDEKEIQEHRERLDNLELFVGLFRKSAEILLERDAADG